MMVVYKYLCLTVVYIIFVCSSIKSSNINDNDDCVLDRKLIEEIESYKNVTKRIMDEIIQNYGEQMYKEYETFIDTFGARLSGSDVLERAIDHMINITRESGINDVITENVQAPHWVRGFEAGRLIEPYDKNIAILGFGTSINTSLEGITAEAIVINSFEELSHIDASKIKGKIVVFDAHYVSYGQTVKYRSQGATKASKKGAIATLVRSITPFSIYSLHTGAQFYGDSTKIPTAAITHEDADLLRRLQNEDKKIKLNIKMFNSFDIKTSRNTLIDLKGKEKPDKLVIVSGHIDSWDVGTGAMDDGGGMFISWFVPVILQKLDLKPRRTIRAILWTAEEPGLVGAASYLAKHINELDNINFIMESDEGTFKPQGLDVAGSKNARCIVKEILKQFTPIDKITYSGGPGSDITMFINKGVPGASLLNANERYFWFHHSDGDTLNVQNKVDVIECAAFWAAISYVVADLSVDIPRS